MKRWIPIFLIFILCLSLVSCGFGQSGTPDESTPDEAAATEAVTEAASSSPDGMYDTVDDYIRSPEVKAELEGVQEAAGDTFIFDCYAMGDMLVYDYTYTAHFDEDQIASLKDALDESLEENAANYAQILDVLKRHVTDIENPQVELIYRSDDGAVITSRTYE